MSAAAESGRAAFASSGHGKPPSLPGCGSHAEAGPALKVVEEGLQGLVQDLIRGLGRMDGTPARPVADPVVQLLDVQALQGVLDIVGNSRPVARVMTWAA